MADVVWIAAWELQCCGLPFSVGDTVSWRIHAVPDTTWLSPSDAEVIGPVAWAYDHHSDDVDAPTTATVRTIRAVYQRYEVDGRTSADPHGGPRGCHLVPVPATMVAEPRDHADGWERDRSDARFVGYAVHVQRDRAPDERSVERRSPRPGLRSTRDHADGWESAAAATSASSATPSRSSGINLRVSVPGNAHGYPGLL